MHQSHRFTDGQPRTFEGPAGWRAFLDPSPGSGPTPGCGLLPGWTLEVYKCDILRFRESYVDRPGVLEDAEADARAYFAGRLPAWRACVKGALQLSDLDMLT